MLLGAQGKKLGEVGGAAEMVITELKLLAEAIEENQNYTDKQVLTFPRWLLNPVFGSFMMWIGNRGWKSMLIANNKTDKIDAKPYTPYH